MLHSLSSYWYQIKHFFLFQSLVVHKTALHCTLIKAQIHSKVLCVLCNFFCSVNNKYWLLSMDLKFWHLTIHGI